MSKRIENRKKEWLIDIMGIKTLQLLFNLTSPDDPKNYSYVHLVTIMKEHLHPSPSVIAEQNRFPKLIQEKGETISNFVADLEEYCDFKCNSCDALTTNSHLGQQLISGLKNSSWLENLIQPKEPHNSFGDCVGMASNYTIFSTKSVATTIQVS
ncbi:hypothetical protein JTB14_020006 [Gonioctena quinquepunctata]|nr:hypothetical protein JTB14_020006 [Gonioctena quinquepunctata]